LVCVALLSLPEVVQEEGPWCHLELHWVVVRLVSIAALLGRAVLQATLRRLVALVEVLLMVVAAAEEVGPLMLEVLEQGAETLAVLRALVVTLLEFQTRSVVKMVVELVVG
jgi:hypothetical protein